MGMVTHRVQEFCDAIGCSAMDIEPADVQIVLAEIAASDDEPIDDVDLWGYDVPPADPERNFFDEQQPIAP